MEVYSNKMLWAYVGCWEINRATIEVISLKLDNCLWCFFTFSWLLASSFSIMLFLSSNSYQNMKIIVHKDKRCRLLTRAKTSPLDRKTHKSLIFLHILQMMNSKTSRPRPRPFQDQVKSSRGCVASCQVKSLPIVELRPLASDFRPSL